MTNLRNCKNYSIGLDLGVGSVGWAVIDENGKLCKFKGKKTWGSRLFPEAQSAKSRRISRCARRRLKRRKQRIAALQDVFREEIDAIDPTFFKRLEESKLKIEDKSFNFKKTLFKDYYKFPTIYHLRDYLMTCDEKADIRLIYLALHHIMKARGHFLIANKGLKAGADPKEEVDGLLETLKALMGAQPCKPDNKQLIIDALAGKLRENGNEKKLSTSDIAKKINEGLGQTITKKFPKLGQAIVGLKCNWGAFDVVDAPVGEDDANFKISEEKERDKFESICPAQLVALYKNVNTCYFAYVLSDLLEVENEKVVGLSKSMIIKYERHQNDLKSLKSVYEKYFGIKEGSEYWYMFGGPKDSDGNYDIAELQNQKDDFRGSYTAYILGEKFIKGKNSGDTSDAHKLMMNKIKTDLMNEVSEKYKDKLPKHDTDEKEKEKWFGTYLELIDEDLREKILNCDDAFLQKQRYKFNGAIPNQLQCEELKAIIDNQKKHYGFLEEERKHLVDVCESRIPYYVGPLNSGHSKNAWAVKKDGIESVRGIRPWNYEQYINRVASARKFITRMTSDCQYLHGQPCLPKCSLLFQEYCVRQELNGLTIEEKQNEGSKRCEIFERKITQSEVNKIYNDLFLDRIYVKKKDVISYFNEKLGHDVKNIKGLSNDKSFSSSLSSYHHLKDPKYGNVYDCLETDQLEDVIKWATIFEDEEIRQKVLSEELSNKLNEDQIKKLARLRCQGWGNLSKKLINGITTKNILCGRGLTLIELLRNGDPLARQEDRDTDTTLLQKVLYNKKLGFSEAVDLFNKEYLEKDDNKNEIKLSVDEMWASPTYKRAVRQAEKVVDEIVKIANHPPKRISIEVTREEGEKVQTKKRKDKIEALLKLWEKDAKLLPKNECEKLEKELKDYSSKLDNDKYYLYFKQQGKCLYSQEPLDINRLETCQVDHIIPQSYTDDNSLSNRALVKGDINQAKGDDLLLTQKTIKEQKNWWMLLNKNKDVMPDKKFKNLTCGKISDRMKLQFIEKQLTETSQIAKFTEELLREKFRKKGENAEFKNVEFKKVRASFTSSIRSIYNFPKARCLNNFHHAHDAFFAACISHFIACAYPFFDDEKKMIRAIRNFTEEENKRIQETKKAKGNLKARGSFLVYKFGHTVVNKKTGEISWEGEQFIDYIDKVLGHNDVFISRLVGKKSGAFAPETVYSPNSKQKNLQPAFKNPHGGLLDPKKYGGFRNFTNSYYTVVEVLDKKGRKQVKLYEVPIIYDCGFKEKDDLEQYIKKLCKQKGVSFNKILKRQVFMNDMGNTVIFRKERFRLGGKGRIRFEVNLILQKSDVTLLREIDKACGDKPYNRRLLTAGNLEQLYEHILCRLESVCSKGHYLDKFRLELKNRTEKFKGITDKKNKKGEIVKTKEIVMAETIQSILNYITGNRDRAKLPSIGKNELESTITLGGSKAPISEFVWVDQSVTGMFEKFTQIKKNKEGNSWVLERL